MNRLVLIAIILFAIYHTALAQVVVPDPAPVDPVPEEPVEDPFRIITFPEDTFLEWCVREHLQYNYLQPIYEADAVRVTALICDDPRINSLEGIENFPNIEYLDFGAKGTAISDLTQLSTLTKLAVLRIPKSKITDISPLDNLTLLHSLDLSDNSVADLTPLIDLTNMSTLSLFRQAPDYITDLTPLDNLTRINTLIIESNKITDISPLHRMHSLTYLDMADNRITSIETLDNLSSLRSINMNINLVSDLTPLAAHPLLTDIYANNNQVSDLSFMELMPQLQHVFLNQNRIIAIDEVASLVQPLALSFDKNGISDISVLRNTIKDRWLQELGLSYNCISEDDLFLMPFEFVYKVRKEHQCEPIPLPTAYDLATVVNGDILTGEATTEIDDGLMERVKNDSTGPGGCSMSTGTDWTLLALLVLLGVLYRANVPHKGRRNHR